MAWDDDYNVPEEWSATESLLFDELIGQNPDIGQDQYLQALYDAALYGADPDHTDIHGGGGPQHDYLMDELMTYLDDVYGIIFDDVFDWEAWREWYGDE